MSGRDAGVKFVVSGDAEVSEIHFLVSALRDIELGIHSFALSFVKHIYVIHSYLHREFSCF